MILVFLACVKPPPIVTSGRVDRALAQRIQAEGVLVAAPRVMADAPATVEPGAVVGTIEARLREGEEHLPEPTVLDPKLPRDAAFTRNEYLGNIRFGGGFVRIGDVALEVRARLIELGQEARYREEGVRWAGALVQDLLAVRAIAATPAGAEGPPPERRRYRGVHPEDGHDNVNLPRTELVPTPIAPIPGSDPWIVVPTLKLYYTHNGGWFLGQTFGCMAGARVEALVTVYDTQTGRPVWWMNVEGHHTQPQRGQASTAELDQYLIWSEERAAEQLARGWLR